MLDGSSAAVAPSSSSSSAAADAAAAATLALITCGNCGLEEHRLLHHIRLRGIYRRLCTTCVLRFHPQSFCPSCFTVYSTTPSPPSTPNPAVTCSKCYSSSHIECVGSNASDPYVCPLCISPNSVVFSARKVNDLAGEDPEAHAIAVVDTIKGEFRVIDRDNARVLLAAAKISAVSMSKAAAVARAEAERRAKEAATTRKRARMALEHVAYLVSKDKMKKKERVVAGGSSSSSGGRVGGIPSRNTPAPHLMRGEGSRNGSTLTALTAVELREGEKLHLNGSAVPMEVDAEKNKNVIDEDGVAVSKKKK